MKSNPLANAFPPTPERCRQALKAPDFPASKAAHPRKGARMALAFALCLLLLSGIAYAGATSGVLRYLLGASRSNSALEQLVQPLSAAADVNGLHFTLTDLVYDGRTLALSYSIESDVPTRAAFVKIESLTLDGQVVPFNPTGIESTPQIVPSLRLDIAPVTRNPVQDGLTVSGLAAFSGAVQGEITLSVLRPKVGLAIVSDILSHPDEPDEDRLDQLSAVQSLENAVLLSHDSAAAYLAQGYTLYDPHSEEFENANDSLAETARVTLRFTLQPEQAARYDLRPAQDVALADCTLHLESCWLSPLSTVIQAYLIPAENTQQAADALADAHGCMDIIALDANGAPVEFADMDYLSSYSPSVYCKDGQWLCRYDLDLPGLEDTPYTFSLQTQCGILWTAQP